ncbi:MAG: deoxyribodipyrimidine photo-lyase [Methanobacterium sp.]|nr:deoxyribodipyrimidine photo-lyase [Methanobacterium sp.]
MIFIKSEIEPERINLLNEMDNTSGDYVAYWMQASCRVNYNHAFEYAIEQANHLKKPLVVYFGLTDNFPDANIRHYTFLVEGLQEVERSLEDRGVHLVVLRKSPEIGAVDIGENASILITDRGYLNIQRLWRSYAAQNLGCRMVQVETDVVVPVETASPKEEYAAATIRRKIQAHLDRFLKPIKSQKLNINSVEAGLDTINLDKILKKMNVDRTVDEAPYLRGGTSKALQKLDNFIENKLEHFSDLRNNPAEDYLSNMSPYLHFGQISPLHIALQVSRTDSPGMESYLEELIVRRELSMNFTHYNPHYQELNSLPEWAYKTLQIHEGDTRPYLYSQEELESGETHDPYWNAAQKEMVYTGKMHGYMRMYWGKKILEWTETPREAYQTALYLNNKYELDGRDPNGFTGVAWCFGKHDRAWKERKVFGKVRYMNDKGLERKFKIKEYVDRVDGLAELIDEDIWMSGSL